MAVWNPWHGCKKISAGCDNCYVYEKDAMYGKNASVIRRTANFDLPVKKNRRGEYKLLPQEEPVYVCMTSDFFLPPYFPVSGYRRRSSRYSFGDMPYSRRNAR